MINHLKQSVDEVIAPWQNSTYYDDAEKLMYIFWDDNTLFKRLFGKLDLTRVVELAVGHGRHAELIAARTGELIVMDVFEENLNFCKERLKVNSNIEFLKCEGAGFDGVEDGWATSIFCYDAMVHFSADIIESYLDDTYRVLKPGGMALYHHSNYQTTEVRHYGLNPHARNKMTKKLFGSLCEQSNLHVVESIIIDWGGVIGLDCVTLIKKVS